MPANKSSYISSNSQLFALSNIKHKDSQMRFLSIKHSKLLLATCLASIDISQRCKQTQDLKKKNLTFFNNCITNINHISLLDNLLIALGILSLKSAEKKKTISVLRYCSNQHKYYKRAEGIMGRKYLQRFKYKHRKHHHNIFTIKSASKCWKLNKEYMIGITTLYALYKASKANSKFSACRKFKRGGINLQAASD